jgi:hypothetical protein
MKSNIKLLLVLIAFITSSVVFTKQALAQQPSVSFQVFYDELSPYGQWINYSNFGYVWIPDVGPDFVPYSTGGHWIETEYGETWLSDYEWGWAPFHYGRWDYNDSFGWFWVPDSEWGPAWVTWRRAEGYYGWEPMQPGISINISFGRQYDSRYDHWMFIRDRDIDRSNLNSYYVNRTDHDRIIRNSTVISNTYVDNRRNTTYVSGPARADIQRATGRKISPVAIQENNKPGQVMSNGQLRIYRPIVIKGGDKQQKYAPSRISNLNDVKRSSGKNGANQQQNINQTNSNKSDQQKQQLNQQQQQKQQLNQQQQQKQQLDKQQQQKQQLDKQQQQKLQLDQQQQQKLQLDQQQQQKQQLDKQQLDKQQQQKLQLDQQQQQKLQQNTVNQQNSTRSVNQKNTVKSKKSRKNVQKKDDNSEQDKNKNN